MPRSRKNKSQRDFDDNIDQNVIEDAEADMVGQIDESDLSEKSKANDSKDSIDEISSEIKSIIGSISNAIQEQNKIIVNQQKKIEEQDKKINDIIGVITAFLQNGGILPADNSENVSSGDSSGTDQPINSGEGYITGDKSLPNQPAPNQPGPPSPFNIDRLSEVLKAVAVITSSINAPKKEDTDVVGSIQGAIGIASSIAGAFGEGLARIFEAFNQMEERAFKSYATRFKSVKIDDDIEKVVEKAVEKTIDKKLKLGGND